MRHSHVHGAAQGGIATSAGATIVENTIVETPPNTTALYAIANSGSNASITADHVTAITTGGNSAAFTTTAGAVTGSSALTVTNSIARGFGGAYLRSATSSIVNGNANLTLSHSNFHMSGGEVSSGDGVLFDVDRKH